MTFEAPIISSARPASSRAHRVVPADRQDGDLRLEALADEAHVAEEVGVAGVVHGRAVLELDDPAPAAEVARDLVRARAEGRSAGVVGVDHREADAGRLERAALVHADRLDPARAEPDAHLVAADGRRALDLASSTRSAQIVADVVEVAVGRRHDADLLGRAVASA